MRPSLSAFIGPNWRSLSRLAGVVTIGCSLAVLGPGVVCWFGEIGEAEVPTLTEGASQVDAVRAVGGGDGLFARLARESRVCGQRHPIAAAPVWQQAGALGGLVLYVAFSVLARIAHRRQIAVATAKHRSARRAIARESDGRTGSAGFPSVSTRTPSQAPPSVSMRPLGDSADPLAALDAEVAQRTVRAPSVGPGRMEPSREAAVDPLAATFRAPPPEAPADALGEPEGLHEVDSLPSLDELDGGGWDAFGDDPRAPSALGPAPADERRESSAEDIASAPTSPNVVPPSIIPGRAPMDVADEFDGPAPALDGVLIRDPAHVGRDLSIEIVGVGLSEAAAVTVAVAVESAGGDTRPIWAIARRLQNAGRLTAGATGVILALPWREIAPRVLEVSRQQDGSAVNLHVSVTAGDRTSKTRTPIVDDLALRFVDARGAPLGPKTALVTTFGGRVLRGWVGADGPGLMKLTGLEPGVCRVEMEDGTPIGQPGETPRRSLHVTTVGVALADATGVVPTEARHEVVAVVPGILYVSSLAAPGLGDGSRGLPFATLAEALGALRAARAAGDQRLAYAEIRIDPTATLPTARHGLARSRSGTVEWVNWWTGAPADPKLPWVDTLPPDALRELAIPAKGTFLQEDVSLDGLSHVRIVNSGYAEFRERVARSPGFQVNVHTEYGSIPQAVIAAPAHGPSSPARLSISDATDVVIEGIHLLGCPGQTGIVVRSSKAVLIRRCWVELFASGALPNSTSFGVGRGLQIDQSGGTTHNEAVLVVTCDIGWNRASRRPMPVRGAGVSVFESNVEIIGCFVHDNVATDEPADVAVQGSCRLKGEMNHRVGNRVDA